LETSSESRSLNLLEAGTGRSNANEPGTEPLASDRLERIPTEAGDKGKGESVSLNYLDASGTVRRDLPVVTVELVGEGHSEKVLTLDDSGAGANFISLEVAERLGFDPERSKPGPPIKLGNSSQDRALGTVQFKVRLDLTSERMVTTDAFVMEGLGFPLILGYSFGHDLSKTYRYDSLCTWVEWTAHGEVLSAPIMEGIYSDA